jgi:uncharacterized protein (DUF2267 family)
MKFKGFEGLPKDIPVAETKEKPAPSETRPIPPEETPQKVDRRPRLLSDLKDEELIDRAIQAVMTDERSAEEISRRVNQGLRDMTAAREAEHLKDLNEKFGNLSDEELVREAVFSAVEDPEMAREITRRVNQSLRDKARTKEPKEAQKESEASEEAVA